jgi:hypothetical protein
MYCRVILKRLSGFKKREEHDDGKSYIMNNFIIYTHHRIQNEGDEMDWICDTHGKDDDDDDDDAYTIL